MGADGSTGGRDSVGSGPGSGWLGAGARLARVGAWTASASVHRWARCIDVGGTRAAGRARSTAHPDRNGRRGGWRRAVGAMRAAKRDACKTAAMNAGGGGHKRDGRGRTCGKQARPAPQGAKPVRPCRVSHADAAWRKAHSAGPQAAAAERPRGAGNIFASCVISGSSSRKRALGGKIRAPCIPNRPIAPGNGCIGRGCCHLDLEKHAFRAEVARKGAFSRIRRKRDACGAILASQGPGADTTREGDADGGARWARWGAMRAGLPDGNDLDDDSRSAR